MPFDWMEPTIPTAASARLQGSGKAKSVEEIDAKARLFLRLGYPRAHALARCVADYEWEYEQSKARPLSAKDIKAIVNAAYA